MLGLELLEVEVAGFVLIVSTPRLGILPGATAADEELVATSRERALC